MCNNCAHFRIGKQINAIALIWVTFMLERIVWKSCQPFYQTIGQNHVSDLGRVCCIRDKNVHTFVLVMTCGSPRKKRKIMIEKTVSNISMKQSTMY